MKRALFPCTMLVFIAACEVSAQVRIGPHGPMRVERPASGRGSRPAAEWGKYHLSLARAAKLEQPLRYQFLPDPVFAEPGNGVPHYYHAILTLQRLVRRNSNLPQLAKWEHLRPDELPRADVRDYVRRFYEPLTMLQRGTRRTFADWDLPSRTGWGGDRHPEYQWLSRIILVVDLRIRLAVADRDFDKAEEWMQVGWQLSYHLGRAPLASRQSMSVLLADRMLGAVRHWIGSADSPNLYWALARLPLPTADPGQALERRLRAPELAIAEGRAVLATSRSEEGWERLYDKVLRVSQNREVIPQLNDYGYHILVQAYPSAKKDLRDWGYTSEQLAQLPPSAVMLVHQYRVYRHNREAIVKWLNFPPAAAEARIRETLRTLEQGGWVASPKESLSREWFIPMWSTTYAVERYLGFARQSRYTAAKRDALMTLEAIRDHMAAHEGRLPHALREVTGLPVPNNPLTGRPFEYRWVSPQQAVLRIAVTQEDEDELQTNDWQELVIEVR